MEKKALDSDAKGKEHSKKVQDQNQIKNFLTVKLNPKLMIQKMTIRFIEMMAIMICKK